MVDCSRLSSYRGDPAELFSACCAGEPDAPASGSAAFSSCPALGSVPASVQRLSENVLTCTYSPSPLWGAQALPEGSPGRAAACAFLASAKQGGQASGAASVVHLSGETASAPAFLARWRGFDRLSEASPPEEDAACEAAVQQLGPTFEGYLRARLRPEAGRLLPGLAGEVREPPDTYAQHFPDWGARVSGWQSRLGAELAQAATQLRSARAVALAACFPVEPAGAPAAEHLGAYGRTMGELLTAGLDARGSVRPEAMSSEDPLLNGEGAAMCAALPSLLLRTTLERAAGEAGEAGAGTATDPDWWKDASAVRACYANVGDEEVARLRALLDADDPRLLDAFRLVRGWRPASSGAPEACGRRTAALHKALHNLAVFYHASAFFREGAGLPEACRMTEAERREPWHQGRAASEPAPPACEVGPRAMCSALPNLLSARPDGLGHGVLRAMVTPGLLRGEMLSVAGAPAEDNELNVALARALAAHRRDVCEVQQWSGVRLDEQGAISEAPNFCRRDLASPWLFSEDPGRGACGRALAFVRDTPLAAALDRFPSGAPYCPAEPPPWMQQLGNDPASRVDHACCCDVTHYSPGVQICSASQAPGGQA
jgi:hypothetical protein